MSCPSADSLDISLLSSVEWSNTGSSLSSFLDHHGKSLPHIVRVQEGFCGDASSWTIDSGQILILHALHKETKILAKDSQNYDLYIPRNFQVKVEMIPKNAAEEYSTVRDLLRTFPNYFRVLEGIPSHEVTSGSIYKIIPQDSRTNDGLECLQIGAEQESRKAKFPLSLQGRFQPLFDSREFFLDEVYSEEMDNLPVTVHFVKAPSLCMQGINVLSLNELGNIRLIGECETESVLASVINSNGRTVSVFPKNLLITIEAAKSNATYEKLREAISETQEKILKRIQRLNKLGLHQGRNPIRQFPSVEILPPLLPKPRSQSTREDGEGTSYPIVKKRSNSTPPLPRKQHIPKNCQDTDTKKPLTATTSVPLSRSPQQGNRKDHKVQAMNHPDCKPPPPPLFTAKTPLLPPKAKLKHSQETAPTNCPQSSSTTDADLSGQQGLIKGPIKSPPVPPPRRRRRKLPTKTNEETDVGEIITKTVIDEDTGYICMDHDLEERQHLDYELMDRSWIGNDDEFDDQSNMTLEELFGCATSSEDETGSEVVSQTPRENGKSSSHQRNSVDYENTKGLNLAISDINYPDYENTKQFDVSFLSGKSLDGTDNTSSETSQEQLIKDSDSWKIERLVSNNISRPKSLAHSYENTKHLNLEQPCGTQTSVKVEDEISSEFPQQNSSNGNTKIMNPELPCETTVLPTPNVDDHRVKLRNHGYENTSPLTFKQRELTETEDNRSTYENTKLSSIQETSTQIRNRCMDGGNPDNAVKAQNGTHKINHTLTKTDQIVQEISKRRLSPIGMEQQHFHQEEAVYTPMNENNDCLNDIDHYSLYTSMDDSFDSSIYENNSSDEDTKQSKESCYYEPMDVPLGLNSQTKPITCERRGKGVGSPVDTELHYHHVDISSIISSSPRQRIPSDHAYEDVDIRLPESPGNQPTGIVICSRPTPPQRRPRTRKTDDSSQDENVLDINQNLCMSLPSTLLDKTDSIVFEEEPAKSSDFAELDDLRLYLAKKESIGQALFDKAVRHKENQNYNNKDEKGDRNGCGTSTKSKDVKSRPPAPPPKKPLNYVKVETNSENTGKTFKKKPPTKYSEVETKPRHYDKADDMEYVDDIELYLFERANMKTEQERKDERLKNREKDVPIKAKTISGICKPIKSCIPNSRDSDKSRDFHKPLVYSSSAPITDREDSTKVKPKKHSTVPPPKPKRVFLNSSIDSQQTKTDTAKAWTSIANDTTDARSSLRDSASSPAHPNRKGTTKKPPKPIPRKKVQSVKHI